MKRDLIDVEKLEKPTPFSLGTEEIDIWPEYCYTGGNCLQCIIEGKVKCAPRFRIGKKKCPFCRELFTPVVSHGYTRQFCCRKCANLFMRKGEFRKCKNCRKEFWASASKIVKGKAICCSRSCMTTYRHKQGDFSRRPKKGQVVDCDNCGKQVYKLPSQMRLPHHFCSRRCSADFQKNRVLTACAICGREIEVNLARFKASKSGFHFCSMECTGRYLGKTIGFGNSKHPVMVARVLAVGGRYNGAV